MSEDHVFEVHPDMVGRLRRVKGAMIADNATVIGDGRLGADVSIWFGVTIRGDDSAIEIGEAANIQDNSVVHADLNAPHRIGEGVSVGHGALLHGVEIGKYCLVGMGAKLLGGSRIGEYSIIAAGTIVLENKVIPPRSVVVGVPGKVLRSVTEEEVEEMHWRARHYVQRARTYLDES